MSGLVATIRAYAELMRISNAPTVVTNALVGCAIAAGTARLPWPPVVAAGVAVLLMYVAGMALNDALDVEIDRRERPGRPIPSGRISLRAAHTLVIMCMALALAILGLLGRWPLAYGAILAATIILYDLVHARTRVAVVVMGLCRGLAYVVAAAAVSDPRLVFREAGTIAFPVAMILYIIVLSIAARREVGGAPAGSRRWLALAMPLIALAPALFLEPREWTWAVLAGLLMIAWLTLAVSRMLRNPPRTRDAVLGWLAGICLVDAFWLTLLDRVELAAVAVGCFMVTARGHRRIAGT